MSLVLLLCIANLPTSDAGAWFRRLFGLEKTPKTATEVTTDGKEAPNETSPGTTGDTTKKTEEKTEGMTGHPETATVETKKTPRPNESTFPRTGGELRKRKP
uniref:Secreted mucin n=1 Tax=Trichobilharzia regenti TaxID=157069 RepID=A0AA85IR84_TRIRE|nr:unnamed protein product [Trichobilharzia regenti]